VHDKDKVPDGKQSVLPMSKRRGGVCLGVDTNDNEALRDLMDYVSAIDKDLSASRRPY
jgi:hypothetical protein